MYINTILRLPIPRTTRLLTHTPMPTLITMALPHLIDPMHLDPNHTPTPNTIIELPTPLLDPLR
jgi:hypothetical protein